MPAVLDNPNRVPADASVVRALLNARYFSGERGQFISEDPSHLAVGNQSQLLMLTGKTQQAYLADPQSANSYSYGRNNPIANKDSSGNFSIGFSYNANAEGGFAAYSAANVSANATLVVDVRAMQAWVVESYSGAINAGYMNTYQSAPDNGKAPFVLGLYGGYGRSFSFSPNTTNPNDLQGIESSVNVNIPVLSFSAQGEETGKPTYTIGAGVKGMASVSQYPVYTQVTKSVSVNQFVNNAANRAAGYYQVALAGIQAQINSIQSKINEMKTSLSAKSN